MRTSITLLWSPKNYFIIFPPGLGLLVARTATSLRLPIAWAPARLTQLYFISKIFTKIFLLIFELIRVPNFSLNIFPNVLAVRTDTGHRNSRMYGVVTVRVLQLFPSNLNFVLEIYLMQTVEGTVASSFLHFPKLPPRCCGASKALSPVESVCSQLFHFPSQDS